jgi:integrase/recombinase XerD
LLSQQSHNYSWLSRLEDHLKQARYSPQAARRRSVRARQFLVYLHKRNITPEAAQASDVNLYLQNKLKLFRQRHQRAPKSSMKDWRSSHAAGIHMLLRLVQGQWPPTPTPSSTREVFRQQVCQEYDRWMGDLRGLAPNTRSCRCAEANRFLTWLEQGSSSRNLIDITGAEIDAYTKFRATSLRRRTLRNHAVEMRSFVRFLHNSGRIARDLSTEVIGPRCYAFETIPSSLRPEEVRAVVETTRKDRSREGRRDYAILMLLSAYGLRAGEITTLRLEDVDWRSEALRIRHSKTGIHSQLPLLPTVGNAILDYLQKGRPKTPAREIFICHHAPYGPFRSGPSLYWLIRNRLTAAGINRPSKRGPHSFRHTRAVSMLRAGVPLKEIGDVLGHRSAASTTPYLKLATEDLRGVALEIPAEVKA